MLSFCQANIDVLLTAAHSGTPSWLRGDLAVSNSWRTARPEKHRIVSVPLLQQRLGVHIRPVWFCWEGREAGEGTTVAASLHCWSLTPLGFKATL